MDKIKKAVQWVVYSSSNAENVSLTVKAFLYGLIPGVMFLANLNHVQVSNDQLSQAIDLTGQIIITVGGAVSAITVVVGLARKVWATLKGTNDVVNSWPQQ